jgi:quercetin dioxygenase-like cupin family protein
MTMKITRWVALGLLFVGVGVAAQTQKEQLTILGRSDLSVPGREAITAIDDLGPASATGWHTHRGEMVGYVTEGSVVIELRGKAPLTVGSGQSFVIPAGIAHNSRNTSRTNAQMFVTFIVEKDKPLSAPARDF